MLYVNYVLVFLKKDHHWKDGIQSDSVSAPVKGIVSFTFAF